MPDRSPDPSLPRDRDRGRQKAMSLANLQLDNIWIQGESYNPSAHDGAVCENCAAIQFSVEVGNRGDRATGAFLAKFELDGAEVHNEHLHSLGHGDTQWVQWRHDPLHAGTHTLTVTADPTERVRESDEQDNAYTHQFEVLAAVADCREMTFEGETVTGHVDFARHGWKSIDVTFTMKNPIGAPLEGYQSFVVFYGPENEESSPTEETNEHGMLRCPNLWIKPTGSVYLTSVPIVGGPFEGGPTLSGNAHYTLPTGATSLFFDVQQGKEEIVRTATNQHEVSEALKLEGKVGVKFEIIELGGGVTHDQGEKTTQGQQIQWKVTVGTDALTITPAGH